MLRTSLTALAALALTTSPIWAQSADTDGDGMVSFEEASAAMPDMTEETFSAADANGDGMLDAEEIAAAQEAGLMPAG